MSCYNFQRYHFIFLLLTIVHLSRAQDEGIETCVITNTSCPCALTPSSGTCMRHQGGGNCLMGECNDGYKCDCMGYELCTISPCSKYTTFENAIPSAEVPFRCHLTPDAGTCIEFDSLLDTARAADSAKQESTSNVKSIDSEMTLSIADMITIHEDKTAISTVLELLDGYAQNITEEERTEVEAYAKVVMSASEDIQNEVRELQGAVQETFQADLKTSEYRRVVLKKGDEIKVVKEEEENEQSRADSEKRECTRCNELKEQIKQLRKERKEAAIEAGTWAKKTRGAKTRVKKNRKNIQRAKLSAAEARAQCVARSQKILERLRNLNSQQAQSVRLLI